MSLRGVAALVAVALLAACGGATPSLAPSIRSIEPTRGYGGVSTRVTIRGDGFFARASQAGGAGDRAIDARHRAWLDGTELLEVNWVDRYTITAVVPTGLAAGAHDLSVENAFGQRASLAAAYQVSATGSPPVLTASVRTGVVVASLGQRVGVTLEVHNGGGTDALGVLPVVTSEGTGHATPVAPILAQDVPAGGLVTFAFTVSADAPGDTTLRLAGSGRDAFTGLAVDLATSSTALRVLRPGQVALEASLSSATVTQGNSLTLSVKLTNGGEAGVNTVQAALAGLSGSGAVTVVSYPVPVDLPPGGTVTVAFALAALSPGNVSFSVGASGTDALSGAATAAAPAVAGPLAIQAPAVLSSTVSLSREQVSVGQQVTLTVAIANAGEARVLGVLPTLLALPDGVQVLSAPAAQDIAGGATATFTWQLLAIAAASGSVEVGAAGVDANDGAAVIVPPGGAVLRIQAPAQLVAAVSVGPAQVSVGQDVTLTANVQNVGGATAAGLAVAVTAPAGFTLVAAPLTGLRLPPGASSVLVWTFRCTASGGGPFTVALSAWDENSGGAVGFAAATGPVAAQRPAALALSGALSRTVATAGQTVTVTLTATNTGEATLRALDASCVLAGAAVLTPFVSPLPLDLPGGASASLIFAYTTVGAGDVSLQVTAGGVDLNGGWMVAAAAQPLSLTVQAPASLSASLVLSPARVSLGQAVTLIATVTNAGGATVAAVAPTLAGAPAGLVARAAPAPQAIAGGASATFRWTLDTTVAPAAGPFQVASAGTDANSGAAVAAPQASSTTLVVDRPAALTLAAALGSSQVSIGQDVTLTLEVTNGGTALALGVTTSVVPPAGVDPTPISAPSVLDIPGGETRELRWTFRSTSAAAGGSFGATASGADANSGAALGATASAGPLTAQVPGALDTTPTLSPLQANVGQTVMLRLVVHNSGQAIVTGVAPVVVAAGTGAAYLLSAPAPVDVPGGAAVPLDFVFTAAAAGSVTFTADAQGLDGNSGTPVSAPTVVAGPLAVQTQPGLTTVLAVSQLVVSAGQAVVLSAEVTNGGSATALAAAPALASGPPGLTLRAGPGPARDVPGGGMVRFQWTFDTPVTTVGTFAVDCSATDANTFATVTAPRATSGTLTVQRPAALAINTSTDRARANVGQDVTVTVTIRNTGEATASAVGTTAAGQGAASAAPLSGPSPASVSIPGGGSQSYVYAFHLAGPAGPATVAVIAAGTDANSAAALSATGTAGPVTADVPASLQVALAAAPSPVSLGQVMTVTMTVTNPGTGDAQQVLPGSPLGQSSANGAAATLVSGPTPGGTVTVAGGSNATFTWLYAARSAGALSFGGNASGRDANSGANLASNVATAPVVALQTPAALTCSYSSLPAYVNRNHTFPVVISVRNTGQATANGVSATLTGSASLTPGAAPAQGGPLAGGSSATFTRSFTAGATGSATVQCAATATDANSGTAVSAATLTGTVVVQNPASLGATLAAPGSVPLNQPFTVTMTVSDGGEATANLVAPSSLSLTAGSTGSVALLTGPAPATASAAPGAPAVFSWTYVALSAGTVQLTGSAQGYDANDGGTVSALATSAPIAVGEVTLIASDPFGDGTPYADVVQFQGRLLFGPRQDGAAVLSTDYDGGGAQTLGFSIAKDVAGAGIKSRNKAAGPYTSFGAAGCITDTLACGPDNEDGIGLFTSVTIAGSQWLVAAGAGYADHVYMAPALLSPVAFDYVDVSKWLSKAVTISAAAALNDVLYLGAIGHGPGSPFLLAVSSTPTAPGLDSGTYGVDLKAKRLPRVGGEGSPKNNNTKGSQIMIDSLTVFGGRLYVANNGGIVRSTTGAPRDAEAHPFDWADATPFAATRTAVTTSNYADLEPADRAVPQLAAFAGRLFAIRNVYLGGSNGVAGGELWMCRPATLDLGLSIQCGPLDWTLVVPASAARGNATVLVATSTHLYLGFNGTSGVQLFRTSNPAPSGLADFQGAAGCAAGTAGCQGQGGDGFGDASLKRFLGAHAFDFGAGPLLYVSVGDTAAIPPAPARLFRITE